MVFLKRCSYFLASSAIIASGIMQSLAFDISRSDNLAVYWGQNSYGATHGGDQGGWQKSLSSYCGLPEINFSNTCSSETDVFPGTNLANCQSMAADIKACQSKGKIITLSLGGATGAATFSSDAQAETFADTVWNLFLGGSSSTRPFGDAVLDGVDLDIEGGSSTGYPAFVKRLRSHANGSGKRYYITAAPQCPFPDAFLGPVLNAVGFDAVYVQFYNNYCSNANPGSWNFGTWDDWAKNTSPNKNVKIYIGAPASAPAAGSGYVDAATLGNLAKQARSQYSSFGGVMLWDASQAYGNGRFDVAIKNAMEGGSGTQPTGSPTSSPTTTPVQTTPTSGNCAGIATWDKSTAYAGGSKVIYNGRLWTSKWWTQNEVPGGSGGVWTDVGACTGKYATVNPNAAEATAEATGNNTNTQRRNSRLFRL